MSMATNESRYPSWKMKDNALVLKDALYLHVLKQSGEIIFSFLSEKYDALNRTTSMLISSRYIFTFAIGAGPVTGLIIPELSSTRTRGKIMGFSFTAHWVGIHGCPTHFQLW